MGWAQRSKRQRRADGVQTTCGNPEAFRPTARVISQQKFWEAVNRGDEALIANFSDRRYAMDRRGTLRRLQPQPPPPAATFSIRTIEPDSDAATV